MVFYGGGFVSRTRTIDVVAGVPHTIEVDVVRAIRFALLLELPDGEREGHVVLRGPGGEVGFEQDVEADDPFGARWQPSLVPGVHEATLECVSGRRYRATFPVAEQEAAPGTKPEPQRIDWQPAR